MRTTLLSLALISAFAASASVSATPLPAPAFTLAPGLAAQAQDTTPITLARRGADDGPNHDIGDDHGRRRGGRGADDRQRDDRGGNDRRGGRRHG